eukprot:scaffold83818_cov35-Tisochrysis_lutea.AAC.7
MEWALRTEKACMGSAAAADGSSGRAHDRTLRAAGEAAKRRSASIRMRKSKMWRMIVERVAASFSFSFSSFSASPFRPLASNSLALEGA